LHYIAVAGGGKGKGAWQVLPAESNTIAVNPLPRILGMAEPRRRPGTLQ
jgi:hypothetical protein